MHSLAKDQRKCAFSRIWTLKEAYIKATGQGLACPLDGFAFDIDPVSIRFMQRFRTTPKLGNSLSSRSRRDTL